MSILSELKDRFRRALAETDDLIGGLSSSYTDELLELIRRSTDRKFGDYQANFAMPLGKRIGSPPREVAAKIVERLDVDDLCRPPQIAGPGFINLWIKDDWLIEKLTAADLKDAPANPTEILGTGLTNYSDFGKALWEYCGGGPAAEPDAGTEYEIVLEIVGDAVGCEKCFLIEYLAGD